MITEITGGLAAANHAYKTAKGILELKTQTEINSAVIEIQRNIIDVQQQLSEAQRRYDEVSDQKKAAEAALAARDDWERTAAQYKLTEVIPGVLLYKIISPTGEPDHYICPHCFQQRTKSILQRWGREVHCQSCKLEIWVEPPEDRPITATRL